MKGSRRWHLSSSVTHQVLLRWERTLIKTFNSIKSYILTFLTKKKRNPIIACCQGQRTCSDDACVRGVQVYGWWCYTCLIQHDALMLTWRYVEWKLEQRSNQVQLPVLLQHVVMSQWNGPLTLWVQNAMIHLHYPVIISQMNPWVVTKNTFSNGF